MSVTTWLGERCEALTQHPWLRSEHELLADIARHAVEPLRVAVAGDVSVGKSSLVNALVGAPVATVAEEETTAEVTWYRDPALDRPPLLGAAHRQVALRYPLSTDLILVDTPGVNTASENQKTTEDALSAGTFSAVIYLVERTVSAGAMARLRAHAALPYDLLDVGAGTIVGGSKADDYAGGGAAQGSRESRAALVADLVKTTGRYAGMAVALMPALGAMASSGQPSADLLALLRRIAGDDDLRADAEDGWGVLREFAPELVSALPVKDFGSTFGICSAADVLRDPVAGGDEVRRMWTEESGLDELSRLLRGISEHAETYTVPAVLGRLRRLAIRLGPGRGDPVAAVVRDYRSHRGAPSLRRRQAAVLLELGRFPHLSAEERHAAVETLRDGPPLPPDVERAWIARSGAPGRSVRERRIAETVAEASLRRKP